jgi:hypothetical protein
VSSHGTLETPGTCHQGALYDRCRLNSGRKGYDGRKVANRLTAVVPFWYSQQDFGKQNITFIAKWLHECHAQKRLEGDHIYLSFALD